MHIYIYIYMHIHIHIYTYICTYIYIYIYICVHFYLIFITYLLQLSLSLIRIYDTYIQTLSLALSGAARISVRVSQEATHWSSERVRKVSRPPKMNIRITTTCTTSSIPKFTPWLSPPTESGNEILVKKGLNALSYCCVLTLSISCSGNPFPNGKKKPKCEYTRYTYIKLFGIH